MLAWILVGLAWLVCVAPVGAGQLAGGRIVTWAHGSWSWFGDPRAVYVRGQYDETFIGWLDWAGHVTIGAYDPRFGLMQTHVIGTLFHDDHSAPSLFVEPDQRLTAFWSGHNGQTMDYRTTLSPQDISAWGPVGHIRSSVRGRNGFTYPNPVMLGDEGDKLYLFWRGRDYSQDFATRALGGGWSPARRMIAAPGQRPYVKYDSNGTDTIVMAFTNGHPRERITSIYFAEYRAGWLRGASGRLIAPLGVHPIAPQRGDLVYDGAAHHVSGWVWDVALDHHRRPVIVYATFPSKRNHEYWYASWNGSRWVSHFLTAAGPSISPGTIEFEYSGGLALDHSNPSTVYLSRKVGSGWEIERWTTPNGGYSWSHTVVVPSGGIQNVRPVIPRGGGPLQLLWLRGHYGSYTAYGTSIAFLSGR
jgi:BNR repeat-containing family member